LTVSALTPPEITQGNRKSPMRIHLLANK